MNLAYLILPVIIGLLIGASVFVVQKTNLTGYLTSPAQPKSDNETSRQLTIENKTKCPISCDDRNPCSIDWCNETSNHLCSHTPINGSSEGCWGDPTTCSTNTCVSGKCTETLLTNCCGNNVCESSESCNSCATDCGACPPPTTQASQPSQITQQPQPNQTTAQSSATENQTLISPTSNQALVNSTPNQTVQTSLNHIIISEVLIGPNEFIELYNPTNANADATGWYLSYFSSNRDWNNTYRNWAFLNNTMLGAGKFFLINIFSTSNSDWTVLTAEGNPYSQGQISNNGSIALFPFNPRTKTIEEAKNGRIDALGWGNPVYVFESSPATTPDTGKSLQRTSLNSDTDNNSQDFVLSDSPSPKNSS